MCLVLAACGSGSGSSSDSASASGTIARGGTTAGGGTGTGTGTVTGSGGSTSTGTTSAGATTANLSGGSAAPAPPTDERSISAWVTCDGSADDRDGVARAFAAARHSAFTLVVDCPVRIHLGVDIARTLFIDSGTNVTFTGAGKFIVDNVLHPAFVVASSSDVVLTNWNVEYDGSLPVNGKTGGYQNDGQFVASAGDEPPAGEFNDLTLTKWLTVNRGVSFDTKRGFIASNWVGPAHVSAVFYITGDTSDVTVTGMRVYAPPEAGVNRFVPTVFSLSENYKSNQVVTSETPHTANYLALPHNLTFSDIDLDGTYMGWLASGVQDVVFDKIRSHRYGDLQDANGRNVGGVGKWFAPPHLFYLNHQIEGDPALFNKNLRIHDVVDSGLRLGTARDKGEADSVSGYALSLKLGCIDCSVDTYTSNRPDGFMDVLSSNGLTVSNVTASYDSAFLNNLYSGLRFPQSPYKNVKFENVVLTDTAVTSERIPVSNANLSTNETIVFRNVRAVINRWSGSGMPVPVIAGTGNSISLQVTILSPNSGILMAASQGLEMTLQATPAKVQVGETTTLKWLAHGATSCSANGTWSGSVPSAGSRVVTAGPAGTNEFVFYCQNPDSSSSAVLPVVVTN